MDEWPERDLNGSGFVRFLTMGETMKVTKIEHCAQCNTPVSRRKGRISVSGNTLCGQCYMVTRGPLGVDAIARAINGSSSVAAHSDGGPVWSPGS
jgi:hypothetical protein